MDVSGERAERDGQRGMNQGLNDRPDAAAIHSFERVLGIRFLDAPVSCAIALLQSGGLMVVPSAPTLTTLPTDPIHRRALEGCDFAIVDSAYLTLLWLLLRKRKLHRVSGLGFLRSFLDSPVARARGALFLINPSEADGRANCELLRGRGFEITEDDCYTAPMYDKSRVPADQTLIELLEVRRPRFIMINLAGGIQEPLGLYLKTNLSFSPGIMCTGAAIAFLTGRQASISPRADACGLGWLMRSLNDPRRFVPRYFAALRLAHLVFKHADNMPPSLSPD